MKSAKTHLLVGILIAYTLESPRYVFMSLMFLNLIEINATEL